MGEKGASALQDILNDDAMRRKVRYARKLVPIDAFSHKNALVGLFSDEEQIEKVAAACALAPEHTTGKAMELLLGLANNLPMFHGMHVTEREAILRYVEIVELKAGETLYECSSPCEAAYAVMYNSLSLYQPLLQTDTSKAAEKEMEDEMKRLKKKHEMALTDEEKYRRKKRERQRSVRSLSG